MNAVYQNNEKRSDVTNNVLQFYTIVAIVISAISPAGEVAKFGHYQQQPQFSIKAIEKNLSENMWKVLGSPLRSGEHHAAHSISVY